MTPAIHQPKGSPVVPDGHNDQPNADIVTSAAPSPLTMPVALRSLLDADRTAAVLMGLDGTVHAANETALELFGAASDASLVAGSASYAALRSILDHAPRHLVNGTTDGTWEGDIDQIGPAGEAYLYRATVTVNRDPHAPGGGFVGLIAHDVTVARQTMSDLRHRASHDPLTGLPNRRQIMTLLGRALSEQRGQRGHVAAVFIDLDRLKHVNDALGHMVGDRLLVSVAERLADTVRPSDRVARIGGDEFLVVCPDVAGPDEAMELAERVRRSLSGRLRLRQLDLGFSVSIGVALSDDRILAGETTTMAAALIGNADTAMYEAKNSGRAKCVVFTQAMCSAARDRTALAGELTRAIAETRLTIDYQPVFSAVTRQAVGAEALVRWTHPERGPIEPDEFVSIAEEAGIIGALGEFVLEHAMSETQLWMRQGLVDHDFAIHINVSQVQLASTAFVNMVASMLQTHGLRPAQLVLEAREAALLGRNTDVVRSVRALRRLGVKIAIDNFGTGANALSILTEVGADILKLDGTLGLPQGSTDDDTRLVRAVVLLAHALNMRVVAERVSTLEQLERLRSAGCDQLQGNLLAPAAPTRHLVTSTLL
jgi:diguanylate cyclase (GGDEF)-like protein